MSDDDDRVVVSPEDAENILDWALRAGALIVLMHEFQNLPDDEQEELGADFSSPVEHMFHFMPETLAQHAIELAQHAHDEAVEDELLVSQFQDELDELPETNEPS